MLLVVVALIAANALFVAAEFALVSVDRATVERAANDGDVRAGGVLAALRTLSTQLSGAQLGITVTSLAVGFLIEPSLGELLSRPLAFLGLPQAAAVGLAAALALAVATVFQMVFGELVPKNWAIAEPLRVGRRVAGPQRAFTAATGWLITVLNGTANAILRAFGVAPQEELRSARRPQELAAVATRSHALGALDEATARMLQRAVEFGDRTAADIMTPRPQVRFLAAAASVSDALAAVAETGHARFPVIGETFDDVVGAVHFKHALGVPRQQRDTTPIGEVMKPVAHVPDSLDLDGVLEVLREPGWQLAVVADEYGGTAGIVTFEDLVEELVGEIEDEHDVRVSRARALDDGGWSLDALLRPDEAGRLTNLGLPESDSAETLAGLVQERLGKIADVGDAVVVVASDAADDDVPVKVNVELRVTQLDGRRIERVQPTHLGLHDDVGEQR
jgi:CBS domain containing-hemolysin-like protein